jgi:hypothetical protein
MSNNEIKIILLDAIFCRLDVREGRVRDYELIFVGAN